MHLSCLFTCKIIWKHGWSLVECRCIPQFGPSRAVPSLLWCTTKRQRSWPTRTHTWASDKRCFINLCFSMLRINGCKDEDQLAGFAKVHPVNWPTSAGVLHSHCELDGNFWDCLGYWVKGKSISMTTSAITAKAILWPNVIKEMSQIGRDCARLRTGRLMIKTLQEHHWYPSTEHGISEEPRRH